MGWNWFPSSSSSSSSSVVVSLVMGLLIVFSSQRYVLVCALNYTKYRQVSSLRLARIQRHLDKINKPPVLTILSPDGDTIDCVHRRKQPALDHPLLKNHKIQREPEWPRMKAMKTDDEQQEAKLIGKESNNVAFQMWHSNGTRCPKGTVPIRRSTVQDVLRTKSLYDFGRKRRRDYPERQFDALDVISGNGHEVSCKYSVMFFCILIVIISIAIVVVELRLGDWYDDYGHASCSHRFKCLPKHAIAYTGSMGEIYGARATINVWDPSIEEVNEFSLSQIWVLSGSFDSDLNSIEAGWQSDAYQATGCYNLLCAGFIQTNNRIAIGAAISPLSAFDGNQYDITVLIWKDPKLGNWWMGFGDGNLVGYWPTELFSHLGDHATMVEWGGEIVNTRPNEEHTATQMGSGQFSEGGFGRASYFRNLEIVDSDNSLNAVQNVQTLAENTNCYDIESSYSSDWGTYFYYGGPGRNPNCP
ncbi:neprosin-like protein [Drosera capensis]